MEPLQQTFCRALAQGTLRCRPGQAYILTVEEARAYEEIAAGSILIGYVPTRVLFDFGASYYFTLSAFIIQ